MAHQFQVLGVVALIACVLVSYASLRLQRKERIRDARERALSDQRAQRPPLHDVGSGVSRLRGMSTTDGGLARRASAGFTTPAANGFHVVRWPEDVSREEIKH